MDDVASARRELAAEIRPGVLRPDWSAVTTPAAREALLRRMVVRAGLLDRWSHALEASEDLIWRTVLQLYADRGRPPRPSEVAAETGVDPTRVQALLRNLQLRDLIGLEPGADAIRYAYPFTEAASGHKVELRGRRIHALCAIDALGVGAMYRTDITIASSCRLCSETIRVTTRDEGHALQSVAPAEAVVWYDFAYIGSAASSCCPSIAFFCSDAHRVSWRDTRMQPSEGACLTIGEALELGRAVFGPVLIEPLGGSNADVDAE